MGDTPPVTGSCLCGAVRFSLRLPVSFCLHCHCTLCRRNHGAAYVTWIGVSRESFALDSGEDRLERYDSSEHGWRSFCSRCGSSLFCASREHPDTIDIVLANLHGPVEIAPTAHIFFDDRAPWTSVEDGLPRLGGKTGLEPVEDG